MTAEIELELRGYDLRVAAERFAALLLSSGVSGAVSAFDLDTRGNDSLFCLSSFW
jgi:hypothetical protein